MRIDQENLLAVVLLAMNERYKQATIAVAEQILEDARVEVIFQFILVAHRALAITE